MVETVGETTGGVDGAVEVVAELGGAVLDADGKTLGIILSPVFGLWKAAKIVAPWLGWIEGFLGELFNVIKEWFWRLLGIGDLVLTIFGIMLPMHRAVAADSGRTVRPVES
jgi:hypothetical protein